MKNLAALEYLDHLADIDDLSEVWSSIIDTATEGNRVNDAPVDNLARIEPGTHLWRLERLPFGQVQRPPPRSLQSRDCIGCTHDPAEDLRLAH